MKLRKLSCPCCNGEININIADGSNYVFCPYCGQRFYLDDESITVNKNININNLTHNRYTNDAEVIKANNNDKENKRNFIMFIISFSILIGLMLFSLLMGYLPDMQESAARAKAEREGKICAGYYMDLIGEDYKTVKSHFEAAGFTNIELIDLDDSGIAFWTEGEVETISVGGDTEFERKDFFDPDTKVVISYH